jgi:predicted TIM-barrel fold metal-dependent hydrolase
MRIIAIEEHFTTSELLAQSDNSRSGRVADQLLDTAAGRLAVMDEAGIDLQVLSTSPPGVQDLDPRTAVELARRTNDELAEIVAAHPDRFAGFATLPTQDADAAVLELERCMKDLAFKGTMLHGHTQGHWLDEQRFFPIFEAAVALDAPVYLHPTPPTAEMSRLYFDGLAPEVSATLGTSAWGWHAETGLHALRLVASGLFERLPTLQIVIGHMGENLPFSLARADSRLTPILKHSRSVSQVFQENFWVTTSAYFTFPPLLCALLVFGADRLIFSVDYPYADNVSGRRFLDSAPISSADREKIAHGNAEALLGLAP